MSQISSGIRSMLTLSPVFDLMQNFAGAKRGREIFCHDYLRARSDSVVLDIGCGTAAILDSLPEGVEYYGFDLSPAYIATATRKYGDRGHFICRDVNDVSDDDLPFCDLAIASGLLHHLDDQEAGHLLSGIHRRLNTGGRLVTLDGCFLPGQSWIAGSLLRADRGQNVRNLEGYVGLAEPFFSVVTAHIREDMNRIPYTLAILECTK